MASPMIREPETYFSQWIPGQKACLEKMEAEALREEIPIVGPLVGQMLSILVRGCNAREVLELGTANGYSALWMAEAVQKTKGTITSVEKSSGMAEKARRHFETAGAAHLITVVEGDAQTVLSGFSKKFDFIFMDIDKSYYLGLLPLCTKLLKKGGMMVVDNTAFKDADAFNHAIAGDDRWAMVNFLAHLPGHSPVKDGICLALRV